MPNTKYTLLKLAVVMLSTFWGLVGGIYAVQGRFEQLSYPIGVLLILLGVFLWRLNRIAYSVSKFLIGAVVVLDIVATFGPFYGLDHPAATYGLDQPWGQLLAKHLSIVALSLIFFGILDRYKAEFERPQGQVL